MDAPFILEFSNDEIAESDFWNVDIKQGYNISFAESETISLKGIQLVQQYFTGAFTYVAMLRSRVIEPVNCIVSVLSSYVGFFYVVDGEISFKFEGATERIFVSRGRAFILYVAAGSYLETLLPGDSTVVYFMLHQELVLNIMGDYPQLSEPFQKLVGNQGTSSLYHLMDISTSMRVQLRKLGRYRQAKLLETESAILSILSDLIESQLQQLQQKQYSAVGSQEIAFRVYEHVRFQSYIGPLERIEKIAARYNIGYDTLLRVFKKTFGMTLMDFIVQEKMDAARYLLTHDRLTVTQVSERIGYSETSTFSRLFKAHFGFPPSEAVNHL